MLKHTTLLWLVAILAGLIPSGARGVDVRIKDIARIAGLDEVQLVGYGVVVGLRGSGDKDLDLTKQTVANLVKTFNINIPASDIQSKNVAAVMVTAIAPPLHRAGDHIDVRVASVGDAASLEGGVLLMTPLLDPEGEAYALAQGPLTVGGFTAGVAGPGGQTTTKNHTTVAIAPEGATIKHDHSNAFYRDGTLLLVLREPDFTTAVRMADAINGKIPEAAVARDAATVAVRIREHDQELGRAANFVAELEGLTLKTDSRARIVVNERTGTIVMGANVRVDEAVVAHGNLTVTIGSKLTAYMPAPFTSTEGEAIQPVVTEEVHTKAVEDKAKVMLIPETPTVRELSEVLNQMGATPRDLISILEALRKAGALQMEVVSM